MLSTIAIGGDYVYCRYNLLQDTYVNQWVKSERTTDMTKKLEDLEREIESLVRRTALLAT
jgi:hypothetical protein